MINWSTLFDEVAAEPPATAVDLLALRDDLVRPLNPDEVRRIISRQTNPWPDGDPFHVSWAPLDPIGWKFPSVPLPTDYLDFLAWSNGPWTRKGRREFGFLSTSAVRSVLLGYHFPYFLPGAIPLGLDGGGLFAALDTRNGPASNYPVIAVAAGVLDYSESAILAASFTEFCDGTSAVSDELYPANPETENWWRLIDVYLVKKPSSPAVLLHLRRELRLEISLPDLLTMARSVPSLLLSQVPAGRYLEFIEGLSSDEASCIRIAESKAGAPNDAS